MAVISKMSTYSNSSTGSSVPKPDHRSSNPNLLSSYPLSKQNTSKPLPLLPDEEEERRKAIENYSFPVEKRSSLIKNSNHKPTTRTSPPAPPPSTALKFTDIYQCQPSEDYEECDYEYDYVCLESKKKLEGDDKKIQNLIPKEMQSKYEQLVLRTFDSLNLNSLEKSLSEKPIDSVNPRIILLYRFEHLNLIKRVINLFSPSLRFQTLSGRCHPSLQRVDKSVDSDYRTESVTGSVFQFCETHPSIWSNIAIDCEITMPNTTAQCTLLWH